MVIQVGELASPPLSSGHITRKLRGGMPPLRLCDNRGARAYEKRYKTKKEDQDTHMLDTRPPLPRKKRTRATTPDGDHDSAQSVLTAPVDDIHAAPHIGDQVPDFATAMKHARPKPKPQPVAVVAPVAHVGPVLRRNSGALASKNNFMAENFEDYSGSVPTKSRSVQQRQEAVALADSKRLDGLTQLGAALLRRDRGEADPVRPDQPGHSVPQDADTAGLRVPVESLKSIPWIDQQVEGLYCQLCHRWVDSWHLRSKLHTKKVLWYNALSSEEQVVAIAQMEKATLQIWSEKATKAKLRGGALADAVMPASSTNMEAAASSDQRASVLVQSEVRGSPSEAVGVLCDEGSATGGDLGNRVAQDTPSEISDCDLLQILSDTLRNHYLISVRTTRAWVPIRATPDVLVGEVYTTVAIAIDIPSHSFDLYCGSFQIPRDLRLRDWFDTWDVELDLARRPHPPVPSFPRRPLPVLEEISLSEAGQPELDFPLPSSQEQFLMGQEDRDVMVAVISNSRSELPLQFYRGTDIRTLTQTYARIKRVVVDGVSPYIRPQPNLPLEDGQHVLALISKPLRGGATIFVSIEGQWRELEIHASTTAWELKV